MARRTHTNQQKRQTRQTAKAAGVDVADIYATAVERAQRNGRYLNVPAANRRAAGKTMKGKNLAKISDRRLVRSKPGNRDLVDSVAIESEPTPEEKVVQVSINNNQSRIEELESLCTEIDAIADADEVANQHNLDQEDIYAEDGAQEEAADDTEDDIELMAGCIGQGAIEELDLYAVMDASKEVHNDLDMETEPEVDAAVEKQTPSPSAEVVEPIDTNDHNANKSTNFNAQNASPTDDPGLSELAKGVPAFVNNPLMPSELFDVISIDPYDAAFEVPDIDSKPEINEAARSTHEANWAERSTQVPDWDEAAKQMLEHQVLDANNANYRAPNWLFKMVVDELQPFIPTPEPIQTQQPVTSETPSQFSDTFSSWPGAFRPHVSVRRVDSQRQQNLRNRRENDRYYVEIQQLAQRLNGRGGY